MPAPFLPRASRLALALAFCLPLCLPAMAQSARPEGLQPLPAVPPPPPEMQPFDAALEPQVTIIRNAHETREEFRANGRLFMVKVTPAGGKPYFLVDHKGDGNFVEADTVGPVVKPPMWVIHSW